jgi:8-oxo-dGTP pyrophosphatase MutT (NUDIX family)
MITPWRCRRSLLNQSYRIFTIRTDSLISPRTGNAHDFYVIDSQDWINVIPITAAQEVVMVRQYRHGQGKVTLEIPGGLLEPGDTPLSAAARELLEETGYQADQLTEIGLVSPNPAIFSNRCYTFLASNVVKTQAQALDPAEDIEVELVPLADIPSRIGRGDIDHALVLAAFYWYHLKCQSSVDNA